MNIENVYLLRRTKQLEKERKKKMQMLFIKVFAILGTVCYALYYSKQILGV
jgi:type VI protein secretion system component VasF|tara:strand:+ start:228 stop:380 length:153 start_codon:yes stop_codon:yes gene_type:complete